MLISICRQLTKSNLGSLWGSCGLGFGVWGFTIMTIIIIIVMMMMMNIMIMMSIMTLMLSCSCYSDGRFVNGDRRLQVCLPFLNDGFVCVCVCVCV